MRAGSWLVGWSRGLWAVLVAFVAVLATALGAAPASAEATPSVYHAAAYSYDRPPLLSLQTVATRDARGSPSGPGVASWVSPVSARGVVVAADTGTALVRYDADFAVGRLTAGGRATASQLDEFGAAPGWARSQTATGPVKYTDGNGVVRLTIKQGSPRTPGSGGPHVELRNADGTRIDPFGNPVSRTSPGNHTPIVWDW